jgi:hypothetical protein
MGNDRYTHTAFRKVRLQVLAVAIVIVVEEEHGIHDVPSEKQGFIRADGGGYPAELGVSDQDRR